MSRIMMKSKKYCFHLLLNSLDKENAKALYNDENFNEWNADSYFDDSITDTETFSYGHYDGPKANNGPSCISWKLLLTVCRY